MSSKKLLCLGMATIDFVSVIADFPEPDTENKILESLAVLGGPIGRGALTASKLGLDVKMMAMAGNGVYSDMLVQEAQSEGLTAEFVKDNSMLDSQHSFVFVSGEGVHRTIFWTSQPMANDEFIRKAKENILEADYVLFDCTDKGLLEELAPYCRENNVETIIDTGSYKEHMFELLKHIDHIVSPKKFFEKLNPEKNEEESILALHKKFNPKSVVMTCGKDGGYYFNDDYETVQEYKPLRIEAVDTCGAGDTFHGAFSFALANEMPLNQIVGFSSWAAAKKCEKLGNGSIPTNPEAWNTEYII